MLPPWDVGREVVLVVINYCKTLFGRSHKKHQDRGTLLYQPRCGTPFTPGWRFGAMPLASRVCSMLSYCCPMR